MSNNLVAAANDPRSTPGRLVPAARSYPALREPNPQVSGGYSAGAVASFAPTLREYWRILNKHKWVVLSVVAAVVALGIVSTLMMTPLYVASVRLQIDRNAAKIVEGGNITPIEGYDFEFMRTQYELMQSRTLAERVASALKLGDEPISCKRRVSRFWMRSAAFFPRGALLCSRTEGAPIANAPLAQKFLPTASCVL